MAASVPHAPHRGVLSQSSHQPCAYITSRFQLELRAVADVEQYLVLDMYQHFDRAVDSLKLAGNGNAGGVVREQYRAEVNLSLRAIPGREFNNLHLAV